VFVGLFRPVKRILHRGSSVSGTHSPATNTPAEAKVGPQPAKLSNVETQLRILIPRNGYARPQHRQASRGWENKPKPIVKVSEPVDPTSPAQYMAKVKLMYDLAKLAFETDSTRAITLMLNSVGTPVLQIQGETITDSYHNLSHHGKSEDKLVQLKVVDEWHMKLLAGLFNDLKSVREGDQTLLERTMILYGSNLGDANAHSTTNMPTLFAGGGFRHGQHLAFDTKQNYPLPNLFVSMLQRLGIEESRFASGTATMRGLEMARS